MSEYNVAGEIIKAVEKKVDRIEKDIGHAFKGEFDKISKETRRELEGVAREFLDERTIRLDIPLNDKTVIQLRRKRDKSISIGIQIHYDL